MHQKTNVFFTYLITFILTAFILVWSLYSKGFDLSIPFSYQLDGLFTSAGIKTILETGWISSNPNLGAPLTYSLLDYPGSDSASFYIIKIVGLFTHNYAVALNSFFFLTFFLTALVSLYVLRRLGLRSNFAIVCSLLFTFIPFHLLRGEAHLFLTTLYVIPLYTLIIFSLFDEKSQSLWPLLACCIFAASSGIYNAFFACYFLMVAGIALSIDKSIWKPIKKALLFIAVIIITVLINTAPAMQQAHTNGTNLELANREASDSEIVGLKISQLLLPIDSHRVHFMKVLRKHYDSTAPLVNENNTATLGLIGSMGFIFLILVLFARKRLESNSLYLFSRLNLAAVLLGSIGGLGALYSYIVSPTIRSYNRISVFIAFFALSIFFLWLQTYLQNKPINKKSYALIAIFFLWLGLYDQVPVKNKPDYLNITRSYQSDEKIVNQIEQVLAKNSMIFQLPVTPFPENPTVNTMKDYELFRPYLHSHTLHWSYGAVRGRKVIKWQQVVASKSVSDMLDELAYAGFTGILIDRNGYADQANALEKQLTSLLKQLPVVSDDNTFLFYDLRNYVNNIQNIMPKDEWYENILRVQHDLFIEARWVKGFDHHEDEVNDNKRWAKLKNAQIRIVNYYSKPANITVNFRIKASSADYAHIKLTGDVMNGELLVNDSGTLVSKRVRLLPGAHYINFEAAGDAVNNRGYFRIEDLSI